MTSDAQRRAWGLPDLANEAAARDTAPHDIVRVVDPAEAIALLFKDGGARCCGRTDPAPVVNLKHGRGPVPQRRPRGVPGTVPAAEGR